MQRLVIGNRVYSSWSLRGWLALRQSGLPFETEVIPMDTPEFAAAKADPGRLPSGRVPTLWEGTVAVWDSAAILAHLEERVGRECFWPAGAAARAHARSAAAEMHAGFPHLRRECPMNLRLRRADFHPGPEVLSDLSRLEHIWTEAQERFGGDGDFLYGRFGAADIMFAPVATRAVTYGLPLSGPARRYRDALLAHPFLQEWRAEAEAEPWTIARFER